MEYIRSIPDRLIMIIIAFYQVFAALVGRSTEKDGKRTIVLGDSTWSCTSKEEIAKQ